MQCSVCGAKLRATQSDLPFRVREHTIAILKDVPVLECENCSEYLIEERVFGFVEYLLESVSGTAELEVMRYTEQMPLNDKVAA